MARLTAAYIHYILEMKGFKKTPRDVERLIGTVYHIWQGNTNEDVPAPVGPGRMNPHVSPGVHPLTSL